MLEPTSYPLPFSFRDCQLFYLILENCESFFDMCDCCCNCGEKLGVYILKPSCCSKELVKHAFLNLGVGANIVGEIKRDPFANDLLFIEMEFTCLIVIYFLQDFAPMLKICIESLYYHKIFQ